MPNLSDTFTKLNLSTRRAIMPFITAGDPDLEFTGQLLLELDQLSPGLFEIGFPYSDPIADGPVIQSSYTRALANHLKVDQIFEMMCSISDRMTQPTVAMVSYAIVLRYGLDRFLEASVKAGFSGLIVPDFLWNSRDPLQGKCQDAGLHLIPLITPTTPKARAAIIAKQATGFIYYVSVAGVTGERTELPRELADNLTWLRTQTLTPICVGFGVSGPPQVDQLKPFCDGLIVGSAVMRRVAKLTEDPSLSRSEVVAEVKSFVESLIQAAE